MSSPSALQPFSPSINTPTNQNDHTLNQPLFQNAVLLANRDTDRSPSGSIPIKDQDVNTRCRKLRNDLNSDIYSARERNISRDDKQFFLDSARGNIELMNSEFCRKPDGSHYFTRGDIQNMKDMIQDTEAGHYKILDALQPYFESGKKWVLAKAAQGIDKASAFASWINSKDAGQKIAIVGAVGLLVAAYKIPSPQGKAAAGLLAVVAGSFGMSSNELISGIKQASR
jgi:hypothetical protein